jgi:hypothetical protein
MLAVGILSTECSLCAQANCCNLVNACFLDPACKAFETCLQNCANTNEAQDGGSVDASAAAMDSCDQTCLNNTTKVAAAEHNAWAPQCVLPKCAKACGL